MPDAPLLIDLRSFVDAHGSGPRYKLLGKLVRNAHSMVSIRFDLHRALTSMQLLSDQQAAFAAQRERGEPATEAQGLLCASLFVTSLFLYARAVHSQGRDRSTLDLRGGLPAELRAEHERILALRDQHFAHYVSGGAWEDYRVVLVLGDDTMGISYPNERRLLRAEDAYALHRLLEHAQALTERAYLKASERLNLEINRLFDDDDFADACGGFRFEPARFFSSGEVPGFMDSLDARNWSFDAEIKTDFSYRPPPEASDG
ncbi:MAG: hypothetical protein KYX69_10320 [Sphingomonas sp.]|uniref:hypothetical protein n=1 Tax=Sphingomonas sp. TaxID=28214 RepID=UPI00260D8DC6|nr:hypothetical protein [Sphingomonas sp.]MDK2768097.1 hypothetical protein [Sphingomonas sp.]